MAKSCSFFASTCRNNSVGALRAPFYALSARRKKALKHVIKSGRFEIAKYLVEQGYRLGCTAGWEVSFCWTPEHRQMGPRAHA
ncbi:hypothetical protein PybrP1_005388 [[Pythium] brassicae (nom. inval.)]|nr:hypothetical protein PybrP1_005388 [[Pythium] brassicae (nom. inval.)]